LNEVRDALSPGCVDWSGVTDVVDEAEADVTDTVEEAA